jgi:hypothetical protein
MRVGKPSALMSYWRTIRIEMPSSTSRRAKSTPLGITRSAVAKAKASGWNSKDWP